MMEDGVPGRIGAAKPVQAAKVTVCEMVGEVPEYPAGPETAAASVVWVSAVWPKQAPAKPAIRTRSDASLRKVIGIVLFSLELGFAELAGDADSALRIHGEPAAENVQPH